jgi:hypothetical protein
MPEDRAMAMNRNAKKEQAIGAILRIMSAAPPPPLLSPLILKLKLKMKKKKRE